MTDSVKNKKNPPPGSWSSALDPQLTAALKACGVTQDAVDPWTIRLRAVPLNKDFNKLRSNLLVRRQGGEVRIFVDSNLEYQGAGDVLARAFGGTCERNWRKLTVSLHASEAGDTIRNVLRLLQSPIIAIMQADVSAVGGQPSAAEPSEGLHPHSVLATDTQVVDRADSAVAFRSCLRKELAQRLAVATTRNPPCACVVWAASGTGKDHLLLAAAHILLRAGRVQTVRRLPAARLTCGRVFAAERDSVLSSLMDELVAQPRMLLLVDHVDLALSGTPASLALVADAVDRGAKILATVSDENFLKEIGNVPWLARRVLPVNVPPLDRAATLKALTHWARGSGTDVSPAALQAAIEMTQREGETQPAAALDLLGAALAEATWRRRKTITPDDITSVLQPDWPE